MTCRSYILAAGYLLLLLRPVFAADPHEPNESKASATVVKNLENAVWKTVEGTTFHSGSDRDWFRIVTTKKGILEVEVTYLREHRAELTAEDGSQLTADFRPGKIYLVVGNLEPGNYFLELKPLAGGTGNVALRVRYSDPTTYRGWLVDHHESPDLPSSADPNGDGVSLGIEYALSRPPNPDSTFYHPVSALADALGMVYLVTIPITGTKLAVTVEMSTDLKSWKPVPKENFNSGVAANPIPAGQSSRVEIFFHYDDLPDKLFLRLATPELK